MRQRGRDRVATPKRATTRVLRVGDARGRIVAAVDNVLNPRTHLRRTAEELRAALARLMADPTADDRRTAELRVELQLVEAELAALERHHRRRTVGR